IGWMAMGLVDTMMVGHMPHSAQAICGVSLGGVIFYMAAMFGGSILFSLDTKVSQSFGAGNLADANHSLLNAMYIVAPLAPACMLMVWFIGRMLPEIGVNPEVLAQALPFLRAMNWSTLPMLLYFGDRANRAARCRLGCCASDCAELRQSHLHGTAGNLFSRSRAGGASPWTSRSRSRRTCRVGSALDGSGIHDRRSARARLRPAVDRACFHA